MGIFNDPFLPGEGIFESIFACMHWDQLNVLRYCRIEVTGSSIFKNKKSIRLKMCMRCLIFKRPFTLDDKIL